MTFSSIGIYGIHILFQTDHYCLYFTEDDTKGAGDDVGVTEDNVGAQGEVGGNDVKDGEATELEKTEGDEDGGQDQTGDGDTTSEQGEADGTPRTDDGNKPETESDAAPVAGDGVDAVARDGTPTADGGADTSPDNDTNQDDGTTTTNDNPIPNEDMTTNDNTAVKDTGSKATEETPTDGTTSNTPVPNEGSGGENTNAASTDDPQPVADTTPPQSGEDSNKAETEATKVEPEVAKET